MYFDSNDVYDSLKCSFCKSKFVDVVKLIPECGNSICGPCHQQLLQRGLTSGSSSQFKCLACKSNDQMHSMPNSGELPNNVTVLQLIRIAPKKKALNDKSKTLCSTIDDLTDQIVKLKLIDRRKEVNGHCDNLKSEVTNMAQNAIQHLVDQQDDLLARIDQYRDQQLSSEESSSNVQQEFADLCGQVSEFQATWHECLSKIEISVSDEQIRKAQHDANEFKRVCRELDKRMRSDMLCNRVMAFRANRQFFKGINQLGVLDFLNESPNTSVNVQ